MGKRPTWIVESTIDYDYDDTTKIRGWRTEPKLSPSYDNSDLIDLLFACQGQHVMAHEAAYLLAASDRVAAVQVIYHSRGGSRPDEGFVIYTDWP